MSRDLYWRGCVNVRDLGGLVARNGRITRSGSVVRADNPASLTSVGWETAVGYGVRTVVALRTEGAADAEPAPQLVPPAVVIERVTIEDINDPLFRERCVDNGLWVTPLYFGEMLEYWPDRCAAAVRSVASSRPGAVVISCGRGCDRTGLLSFLLLALVGVAPEEIAADWEMSIERVRPLNAHGEEEVLYEVLEREGVTPSEAVSRLLRTYDVADRLRRGGLSVGELRAVKDRLLAGE